MKYRFQIASDVIRDGLAVELFDEEWPDVAAEVFRCDATHALTVTLFKEDLPFVLIEKLIGMARRELRAYEDGTPLPEPMN